MFKLAFEAIGTTWAIDTSNALSASLERRVRQRIADFDAAYSRFRADSLVARIARAEQGGPFRFPEDAVTLFDFYDRLHEATCGAVDPLVGRDLELLGYDASYSLRHDPLAIARYAHERRNWREDIERNGACITTRRPVVIDVGAAGKGYLVEIVADMLRTDGHEAYVVDGGGDLRHVGPKALDVGLEDPNDPAFAIGIAHLKGRALCASATNRRSWGPFHHIVDGRTGVPVRDVVATWVIADDAMTADGLATALFFTPADRLAETFEFSFVRMLADGRAEISTHFDGELFS
ncbi:FAD:protein FMN transferase [Aureimonas altamirensis]|uniref:FAD:protein FMN transferase n=1 Tax=Aureimonas altamirensis TaxID=370622 RepID=UPI001E4D8FA9|nr:FAD:protein FMN transferase [Aureimonas altamirensis]UHD44103.1 FAD:protein FMN transferase [Aureimonas altamirensis]